MSFSHCIFELCVFEWYYIVNDYAWGVVTHLWPNIGGLQITALLHLTTPGIFCNGWYNSFQKVVKFLCCHMQSISLNPALYNILYKITRV